MYANRHYYDRGYYHYNAPTAPVVVKQSEPKIIYVERAKEDAPMHRRIKTHNYIYNQQPTRVIIEHADGTATIVDR
jgi:hypothetical protein